jgi:hypothetical protein
LKHLHPEVKVKILYQRDYVNLLVKFGLEDPSLLGPGVAVDEEAPTELPIDLS